jgi:hypothetical protein
MKIFFAILINLIVSLSLSVLFYTQFKLDVSPTIISIILIVAYLLLPQKFHDWMADHKE